METLSGKDTLHDTVGIVYQSVSEETCGAAATALDKSSFFKWGFKEWKNEKKKKLRNFWCGYQALSWESENLKSWTDAAGMYRSTTDSRELLTGKGQQFIVDDSVQNSPKVYSDVGWLKCTTSNWKESDGKDMVSSSYQSVTNIDSSC